jgi:hypothetical protein
LSANGFLLAGDVRRLAGPTRGGFGVARLGLRIAPAAFKMANGLVTGLPCLSTHASASLPRLFAHRPTPLGLLWSWQVRLSRIDNIGIPGIAFAARDRGQWHSSISEKHKSQGHFRSASPSRMPAFREEVADALFDHSRKGFVCADDPAFSRNR